MTECFPATQLRAPVRSTEQVHLAAATVASLGQMRDPRGPKHARIRTAHTIDRTRLKTPYLTIYPSTFVEIKKWSTLQRTVTRFYLNTHALRIIFPTAGAQLPKTAYLTLDTDHHDLLIGWRPGGHPAKINTSVSSYFRSAFIADRIAQLGYLLDDVPTYFPITPTSDGLIVHLSLGGSKADAIAYEEDHLCRTK